MDNMQRFMLTTSLLMAAILMACSDDTSGPPLFNKHLYHDLDSAIMYPAEPGYWTELDMRYSGLDSISESIGQAVRINAMYFGHNNLIDVPRSIKNCRALVALELSYNRFTVIPDLKDTLTSLDLDNNRISSILPTLSKLKVSYLNLANNLMSTWPDSLRIMDRLGLMPEMIDLRGNPMPAEEVEKVRKLMPKTRVLF